jgi:pyrroline-5-carboxylate reductase
MNLTSISFIGGGNMAMAMIKGLVALQPQPRLTVSGPNADKLMVFSEMGVATTTDNAAAVAASDLIVLAIKPQKAALVVPDLAAAWSPQKILVSILAGTTTAKLASWLPPGARIVRAMPNTPLAIGQGMVGVCAGATATAADVAQAEALFTPCGKVLRLADESRMDAITAVSGSGPAYVFAFAEALMSGAQALGFTADEAALLVGQTLGGATAYLQQQGVAQAATLRQKVTSPGGTTAAALAVLTAGDQLGLITRALAAAEARGRELGRG